jgi:hypothetical protein
LLFIRFSAKENMAFYCVRSLLILFCVVALLRTSIAAKQQVFYGEAELVHQLLTNISDWTYVQENVDGFYVNFIEMYAIMTPDDLLGFFNLYKNKSAYFESDANPDHQPLERDKTAIVALHKAGWNITHTSQNYGWTVERDQILGYYNLTEKIPRRPDFVQLGPWTLSGNISNDPGTGPYPNSQYRAWINQSDGVSTDGPLGFWSIDFQHMREGSYSTVQYAHSIDRPAAVMLCPYGAGINTYNSTRDFLTVGISAIHGHEDNDADPDIWIIFEYADASIPAVPEQVDGYPANTTTGMAYYALKHRDGEPETLDLYLHEGKVGQFAYVKQSMTADMILNSDVPLGTTLKYTLHVADYSPWLDYAACIRTFISSGKQNGWNIQYSMNEVDITTAVTSIDGFVFIREYRVRPNSVQSIVVSFTRISTVNQNAALIIELAPHRGSDVVDSIRIML